MDPVDLREQLAAALQRHVRAPVDGEGTAADRDGRAAALQDAGTGFFMRGQGARPFATHRCFACAAAVAPDTADGVLLTVGGSGKSWFALCVGCHERSERSL